MSTWLAWAKAAPGHMVELKHHPRGIFCKLFGECLAESWSTGVRACSWCGKVSESPGP